MKNDFFRVLGCDPGYDRSGIAVVERNGVNENLIESLCVITDRSFSISDRIKIVGDQVQKIIDQYSPDCVAVETLFFNKNVKTALHVAEARGVIMYLAKNAGCMVVECSPQEIKVAITGYGKSDKAGVISMVKKLVKNAPKSALDDEYDAIAIALTALHTQNYLHPPVAEKTNFC